jgi:E3 ubiquitin-protein ligase EDD1
MELNSGPNDSAECTTTLHIITNTIKPQQQQTNPTTTDNSNELLLNDNDTFDARLEEIGAQISSSSGSTQSAILSNLSVQQAVVSSTHLAFLLNNGRICRVGYEIDQSISKTNSQINSSTAPISRLNSNSNKHSKLISLSSSGPSGTGSSSNTVSNQPFRSQSSSQSAVRQITASNSSNIGGNTSTNLRGPSVNDATFIIPSPHDILSSSSLSHTFGRGRRNQLLRGRVSSLIVGHSSRIPPFVPASAVPESLIESVQTVLQSKSRTVIIRELQRTNLDLNLAVNNLLQRDDEGDDPTDDDDPYMHGG